MDIYDDALHICGTGNNVEKVKAQLGEALQPLTPESVIYFLASGLIIYQTVSFFSTKNVHG